ncbi:MAG: class I SAM-dependent methyltransferase [Comamonas sp.]
MPSSPSPWIQRFTHLVPEGGTVLDVACGQGRHLHWFAERGHPSVGIDRSQEALAALPASSERLCADIEEGAWPLPGAQFAAVVVTNYLWRALLPTIVASVAPGGVLLYETFADGNARFGKPSRADFLLQPGELLRACANELQVAAYEEGFLDNPPRCVQRIAARRPLPGSDSLAAL